MRLPLIGLIAIVAACGSPVAATTAREAPPVAAVAPAAATDEVTIEWRGLI